MRRSMKRKAFTIIEMTIVIAVIAILATVMIPTIGGMIEKAYVSKDTQFAASLNVQLALWEVDHGNIENEDDLRNAVNAFYESGYYETKLAPESGNYGYHFLYDITNGQVITKKLSASDFPQVAPVSDPAINFDYSNPRCITLSDGLTYLLMDCGESEVGKLLSKLREVKDNGEYADVIAELEALEDDAALGNAIATNLKTTALANSKGVFAMANTTVTSLYIPVYGGVEPTTLGSSKVPASTTLAVTEINLPTNTIVGSGSLKGFTRVGDSDPHGTKLEGSTVIYVDTTENLMIDSKLFPSDSTNCVIELVATGERYAFVNDVFTTLGSGETWGTDYSTQVVSFDISGGEGTAERDFHFNAAGSTIHYTEAFSGDDTITLTVSNIKDDAGNAVTRNVTWTQGGNTLGTGTVLNLKASDLTNGDITVTAQNKSYTIKVVCVEPDSIDFTLNSNAGNPSYADDGTLTRTYNLTYKAGDAFTIAHNVTIAPEVSCVSVNKSVTGSVSGDGASNVEYTDGELVNGVYTPGVLTVKDTTSGDFSVTITFTTANGLKAICVINFTQASTVFEIADNAKTQDTYGVKFAVGTANSIKLGTLFELKEGASLDQNDITVKLLLSGTGNALTIDKTAADWKDWTITLSGNGENYSIAISDGGAACPLNVKIVLGAHNVYSTTDSNNVTTNNWTSAGTSIVLLNDITISSNK